VVVSFGACGVPLLRNVNDPQEAFLMPSNVGAIKGDINYV